MVRILDTNPLNPNDTLDLFSFGLGADTVLGLSGSDFLTTDTVGGSLIFGNTENDSLTSSTSGDTLYGGQDDDFLVSKGGGSVFFGDLGQDRYVARGSLGRDTVYGGTSNEAENRAEDSDDIFNFGNGLGGNLAFGNGGDDFISGSASGSDTLYGGVGDDTIQVIEVQGGAGGGSAFVPFAVEGIGFVPFGGGIPLGSGSEVEVVLEGGISVPRNPGRNYLIGDKGNDVIFGVGDRDSLFGEVGNDSLFMLSKDATGELPGLATEGDNIGAQLALQGFPRNNWLNGGEGNDYLYSYGGDRGRQTMWGAEGDDSLFNRGSQVLVFGNTGTDYLETTGFSRSTLYGGQDNDTVISGFSQVGGTVGGGTNLLYGDKGNDTLLSRGIRDTLYGGNIEDNDTIAGNNLDYLSLGGASSMGFGNQGNDTLVGDAGAEFVTLYGGQDNDYITAGGANSYLSGDKGNDSISSGGNNSTLVGADGDDTLLTTASENTLMGGEGNDSLYARDGGGNNLLMVTSGTNVLVAGKQTDTLIGGTGNDLLVGSEERDTLRADGPGLDALEGFRGTDSLIGTAGAQDVFLFGSIADALDGVTVENGEITAGNNDELGDTITSFESGRDKIYLSIAGFNLDEEAIAGLRTDIDFFTSEADVKYSGSFDGLLSSKDTPAAIIFTPTNQGGYLIWDANGADPTDPTTATTNDLITLATIQSGEITRNDIFLF
jgi:Ca2+-binding RTX toxin-like protein